MRSKGDIILSGALKRPFLSAVSALAIAIVLTGCASWQRCREKLSVDPIVGDVLTTSTGSVEADTAMTGLWFVVQLGCTARESVRATPPPAPAPPR